MRCVPELLQLLIRAMPGDQLPCDQSIIMRESASWSRSLHSNAGGLTLCGR